MKIKATFAKLILLSMLITTGLICTITRSGAAGIDSAASAPAAFEIGSLAGIPSSILMQPLAAGELRGYKQTQAERMPLAIHGPFVLATDAIASSSAERERRRQENRRRRRQDDNDDDPGDDREDPPCTNPDKCGGAPGGDGPNKTLETPSTGITWDGVMTPQGGYDPQIAVG